MRVPFYQFFFIFIFTHRFVDLTSRSQTTTTEFVITFHWFLSLGPPPRHSSFGDALPKPLTSPPPHTRTLPPVCWIVGKSPERRALIVVHKNNHNQNFYRVNCCGFSRLVERRRPWRVKNELYRRNRF